MGRNTEQAPDAKPDYTRNCLIALDYFKASGKWYGSALFEREFRVCGAPGTIGNATVYIHDVVSYIRGLRNAGGQGALPGLTGEGWDGLILIRERVRYVVADDGFAEPYEDHLMHLLLPNG